MKTFVTLAILASVAATPAMAERFTRDGIVYDYQVKAVGEDKVIAGTNVSSGENFRLRVSGTKVTGQVGRWPVSFRLPSEAAAGSASATVLAAK